MFRKLFKLAIFCFVVYLLWPYNVFQLKDHNPQTTSLMELRLAEAQRLGHKMHPQMEPSRLPQRQTAFLLS